MVSFISSEYGTEINFLPLRVCTTIGRPSSLRRFESLQTVERAHIARS